MTYVDEVETGILYLYILSTMTAVGRSRFSAGQTPYALIVFMFSALLLRYARFQKRLVPCMGDGGRVMKDTVSRAHDSSKLVHPPTET